MGNKVQRQRTTSKIFSAPKESKTSVSVTVPSVCTSPSFHLSLKKSASATSSEQFNWSHMQSVYIRQENLTVNDLTPMVLKMTMGVFEVLKRQMGQMIGDLDTGELNMPDEVAEKWGLIRPKSAKSVKSSQSRVEQVEHVLPTPSLRKMIVHFVKMLYLHDLILNSFGQGLINEALELVKQVAVSHALLGITCTEFRMMDWFITHYLIINKLTSDENINNFLTYLNMFSNYITLFYESQSVRHQMKNQLVRMGKKNDRYNKARENFRLMKKWKKLIECFKEQEHLADTLLAEQIQLRKKQEDIQSIDTIILKEQDCIMKHFVKKKTNELETSELATKNDLKKNTVRSFV
ncbi:uncharacterized protein LOC135133177 [Zophobas morio]|uniref:uncharacterized protein LOC135133177 n=1 Tax=Zophobas morio TaxID=2755281 RepID=UPI003082E5FC